MSDCKPILCLDFDGVCHSYTSGWQGAAVIPDPPVPGLFEFLDEACRVFDVQIYSSRSHQEGGILAMQLWFIKQRALWREAGGRGSETIDLTFPEHKPSALVSLDDRGWRFSGSWPSVADLLAFKPWNRGGSVPAHPEWPASVHPYSDNREDLILWIEQALGEQIAVDMEPMRHFAEAVADLCRLYGWEPAQTEPLGPDALAGLLQGVLSNLGLKDCPVGVGGSSEAPELVAYVQTAGQAATISGLTSFVGLPVRAEVVGEVLPADIVLWACACGWTGEVEEFVRDEDPSGVHFSCPFCGNRFDEAERVVGEIRPAVSAPAWRAGDVVRHKPSGEEWTVAFVEDGRLYACGWPPGSVPVSDCDLVSTVSDVGHLVMLRDIVAIDEDDVRKERARVALAAIEDAHPGEIKPAGGGE